MAVIVLVMRRLEHNCQLSMLPCALLRARRAVGAVCQLFAGSKRAYSGGHSLRGSDLYSLLYVSTTSKMRLARSLPKPPTINTDGLESGTAGVLLATGTSPSIAGSTPLLTSAGIGSV